jgi:hypothetical protein
VFLAPSDVIENKIFIGLFRSGPLGEICAAEQNALQPRPFPPVRKQPYQSRSSLLFSSRAVASEDCSSGLSAGIEAAPSIVCLCLGSTNEFSPGGSV